MTRNKESDKPRVLMTSKAFVLAACNWLQHIHTLAASCIKALHVVDRDLILMYLEVFSLSTHVGQDRCASLKRLLYNLFGIGNITNALSICLLG